MPKMTILDYLYYLLSRREYSAQELRQKSQQKGFELNEILDTIAYLQNEGYQSDTKVVISMISTYKGKYAKPLIKRKCLAKGIASTLFESVWQEQVQDDSQELAELGQLKTKIMKKYQVTSWQSIEPKTKAKIISYLQYRGFNPFAMIKQWQEEESEDYT